PAAERILETGPHSTSFRRSEINNRVRATGASRWHDTCICPETAFALAAQSKAAERPRRRVTGLQRPLVAMPAGPPAKHREPDGVRRPRSDRSHRVTAFKPVSWSVPRPWRG